MPNRFTVINTRTDERFGSFGSLDAAHKKERQLNREYGKQIFSTERIQASKKKSKKDLKIKKA